MLSCTLPHYCVPTSLLLRCKGSIKWVHQHCLLSWITHSKSLRCEMCSSTFTLSKVLCVPVPWECACAWIFPRTVPRELRTAPPFSYALPLSNQRRLRVAFFLHLANLPKTAEMLPP